MHLSTRLITLCAGFMISHVSLAGELPQRWVSAEERFLSGSAYWVRSLNWLGSIPPVNILNH